MCAGAIINARIPRVVFGPPAKKAGRCAHQLYCKEDRSLRRGLWYARSQLNYYRKTARYYGNKGLTD